MIRDPIIDMERAAARLLPKQPGIIVPGWFWEEWVVVFVCVAVAALILCGLSFL